MDKKLSFELPGKKAKFLHTKTQTTPGITKVIMVEEKKDKLLILAFLKIKGKKILSKIFTIKVLTTLKKFHFSDNSTELFTFQ